MLSSRHRHIWAAELERLDDRRAQLERDLSRSLEAMRGASSTSLRDHGAVGELLDDAEERRTARALLKESLSECRSFPPELRVIVKKLLADELDALCKLEEEEELALSRCVLDPFQPRTWMLNDQNEPVEFYDLQCMNVCVAKQRFEEHEKLALDYEKQVRDLKSEFAVFIDERNTWSKQEHFKFEKIRLEYKHTEGTHLVMERLRTEFPDLPLSVLKTHLEWCRQHVLFKQKLNCCRIRFNEERRKFEKETPAIFKQATAKVVAEMENAHEKEQLFCKLSEAHEKLRAWQAQLQSVLAVKMEEEKKKMEEESERLAEREARRLKEAQEKRAMVTARKHDLEMHEMFWASLAAKLESETKMDQFVQAKHHKERASYRMSLHSQKIEAVEVKRLAMEKMQKALEDRLALLRSTVAVEAKRDWNRTIQGTESSSAAKFVAPSPLFKNPSFTNDAILRDKRSKVSLALFDKGLLATDYARQYLISLCKPVPSTLLVHNNGEDVGHGA